MGCCYKSLSSVSDHFALFLIGSQLVRPPAQTSQDLPPDSHSGLRAGGLARRQADRSPILCCSLQQRVCIVEGSHCHIAWNCWSSTLGSLSHSCKAHTAATFTDFFFNFSQCVKLQASKVKFLSWLSFNEQSVWLLLHSLLQKPPP